MALVLNGTSDTITGLQINSANIVDGSIVNADINDLSASKLTGALPAISGASLTNLPAGGITMADHWRITANFTGDATITSNWERHDKSPIRTGNLGTGLTESSGIFTFPSTGWYYVYWQHALRLIGASAWNYMKLQLTNDNSSYTSYDYTSMYFVAHAGNGWNWSSANQEVLIDITNTTNQKMRFYVDNENGSVVTMGSSDILDTGFSIFKLGDT